MKDKLNKKITVLLVFIALTSVPTSPVEAHHQREGLFINDWCVFSRHMETFAAIGALGFAFIPGLQPVGVAYGIAAVGMKVVQMVSCK